MMLRLIELRLPSRKNQNLVPEVLLCCKPSPPLERNRQRPHRARLLLLLFWGIALAVLQAWTFASAQQPAGAPRKNVQAKAVPALVADPVQQAAPAPEPEKPRRPEQMPPNPPQITWDGKQLSIKAENSTLSDILIAVRQQTKATIDVPAGAGSERVVVDLGPASAKEVLTSLLSGSNFDYVIMASDTNEDAIQTVVLSPRGKGGDAGPGNTLAETAGARRTPYFEARQHKSEASVDSAADISSETASSEPANASAASSGADTVASQNVDPSPAVADSTPLDAATAGAPRVIMATPTTPTAALSPPAPGTSTSQMVQDLRSMYQQRYQIQQQQQTKGNSGTAN